MKNQHNYYLIVELKGQLKEEVSLIRKQFDKREHQLPIEITVIGSSGIGPILPGQNTEKIYSEIKEAVKLMEPFELTFSEFGNFPGSSVFFLKPKEDHPFRTMQEIFSKMDLKFENSPFPYTPHCTISIGQKNIEKTKNEIFSLELPKSKNMVSEITLFAYSPKPFVAERLGIFPLGKR